MFLDFQKNLRLSFLRFFVVTALFCALFIIVLFFFYHYIEYSQREREYLKCEQDTVHQVPNISPKLIKSAQQGVITLWFDGAWVSQWKHAKPVLDKKKINAVITIDTANICKYEHMTWHELRTLQSIGWEIALAGNNINCPMLELSNTNIVRKIVGAKNNAMAHGLKINSFATPCGFGLYTNLELQRVAKQHFDSARTLEPDINLFPITKPYSLKAMTLSNKMTDKQLTTWLHQIKKRQGWGILVINQVDTAHEGEATLSPNKLLAVIELIQAMGFEIVTPNQVIPMVNTNK